jgi:hypothetical protein
LAFTFGQPSGKSLRAVAILWFCEAWVFFRKVKSNHPGTLTNQSSLLPLKVLIFVLLGQVGSN